MNWADIWPLIVGPYGALAISLLGVVGIYRLYREERTDRKTAETNLSASNEVLKELVPLVRDSVEDVPQIIEDTVRRVLFEQGPTPVRRVRRKKNS